jgi:hypothetical protein
VVLGRDVTVLMWSTTTRLAIDISQVRAVDRPANDGRLGRARR